MQAFADIYVLPKEIEKQKRSKGYPAGDAPDRRV